MSWDTYSQQVMDSASDLCLLSFIGGTDGNCYSCVHSPVDLDSVKLLQTQKEFEGIKKMILTVKKDYDGLKNGQIQDERMVNYPEGFEVGDMKFSWLKCIADSDGYVFLFKRKRQSENKELKDDEKPILYLEFANASCMIGIFKGTNYQHRSGSDRLHTLITHLKSVNM